MAQVRVWATKDGKKRSFTKKCWEMMGRNKNGWVLTADQEIGNGAQIKTEGVQKPVTGQKVSNGTKAEAEKKTVKVAPEQKEEFLKATQGIKKSAVKDFFDNQFPAVGYSNSDDEATLKNKLGEHLGWDLVKLQKAFNA